MKKKKPRYVVLSPDGFNIYREAVYKSREEALDALMVWVKRYEFQGYYSTSDRTRIPLDDLLNHCEIKEL